MGVAGVSAAAGSLVLPLQLNRLQYTALHTEGRGYTRCVCQSGAETNNNAACATLTVT